MARATKKSKVEARTLGAGELPKAPRIPETKEQTIRRLRQMVRSLKNLVEHLQKFCVKGQQTSQKIMKYSGRRQEAIDALAKLED